MSNCVSAHRNIGAARPGVGGGVERDTGLPAQDAQQGVKHLTFDGVLTLCRFGRVKVAGQLERPHSHWRLDPVAPFPLPHFPVSLTLSGVYYAGVMPPLRRQASERVEQSTRYDLTTI